MAIYDRLGTGTPHGLRQPTPETTADRREAARWLLRAMEDGPDISRLQVLAGAAELWLDVFLDIHPQRSPDWFATSAMLSHPTPMGANHLAARLQRLALAAQDGDRFRIERILGSLSETTFPARIERFLACSRAVNPIPSRVDANWLYLFRANKEWGVVNLGEIVGYLEDAIAEMDELNPELAPYGIVAGWRVHDLNAAYEIAHRTLANNFILEGFYQFDHRDEVRTMKEAVGRELQSSRQLVWGIVQSSASWPYNKTKNIVAEPTPTEEHTEEREGLSFD